MRLKELIEKLDTVDSRHNLADFDVKAISCNSRNTPRESIFVAVKGSRLDGNKFIEEAIARGARAVVFEARGSGLGARGSMLHPSGYKRVSFIRVKNTRLALADLAAEFYGRPSSKIKVAGVTGTNGKTTVTYLIEALLKKAGIESAVVGTINCRFKDKVIPSKNTTPGPIEIQSLLAQALACGIQYAIIEVSSHALHQDRVAGVNFSSAIFTNLTQDHLDYHKTFENYLNCKARLFSDISADAFAVVNNDSKYAKRLKKLTKAGVVTYAIENGSDVMAKNIKPSISRTGFTIVSPYGKIQISSRLIGRHNIYNILAGAAWALKSGIAPVAIKEAIAGFCCVPGRLERVDTDKGFSVFVDYAHTEDALKNIITALRQITPKRIIVVFGCGGERDKTKRPKMGRVVSELSDYAIITNDNPRSENPLAIIKGIKKGVNRKNFCVIPERLEAIKESLSIALPGDTVLVAGKGHENYQIIKDRILPFDDRLAVKECLRLMSS